MGRVDDEIDEVLRQHRVVAVRDHARLRRSLYRRAEGGELRALLPGVFVRAADSADPDVRIRAALAWQPDAVLTGPAAARFTFWPELLAVTPTLSLSRKVRAPAGFAVCDERLPAELTTIAYGVRTTTPALTALDLVATHGGDGIDQVLRRRVCTLKDLHAALALTPGRRGNGARRRALLDSKDDPWSAAERRCHTLLRSAGITGWKGNRTVRCGDRSYTVDVLFAALKVVIEIDGYEFHSSRAAFERDRRKWSELTAHGWRIIHLTWQQILDDPNWVLQIVRTTLALARIDAARSKWAA